MSNQLTLNDNLQALNTLLTQERLAIIHLQMRQLEGIREKKVQLIRQIQEDNDKDVDQKCAELIDDIKRNNDRNRLLLQSGLRVINRLQDNVFRSLALTYAPKGILHIRAGARIFSRSA